MILLAALVVLATTSLGLSAATQQQVLSSSTEDFQDGFNLTDWILDDANAAFNDPTAYFPFNAKSSQYTDITQFITNMYTGNQPWINTPAQGNQLLSWMAARVGNENLSPNPNEAVRIATNPGWRWADVWRPLNLYNVLISIAAKDKFAVAKFLNTLPNNALAHALFPADVRTLLTNNEKAIINNPKGQQWVGIPRPTRPTQYDPFPGVMVMHAKNDLNAKYAQTGAIGPMSLEASFILATQLAGINWQTLSLQIDIGAKQRGMYWTGAILPSGGQVGTQGLLEKTDGYTRRGRLGWVSRSAASSPGAGGRAAAGSIDAGFCLVLDIDPQVTKDTSKKNVFVFATHLIDPASRVDIADNRLRAMTYQPPHAPDTGFPPVTRTSPNYRFYSHGHTAIWTYDEWLQWVGQQPSHPVDIPDYKQIGNLHLYFLPEDENVVWPRCRWLRGAQCPQ